MQHAFLLNDAASAALENGTCPHRRRVYIDLGVNWVNTLHLFEKVDKSGAAYEVYGLSLIHI